MDDVIKLAQQAGFKTWPDGRITAADNGISGSATKSLAEFARLIRADMKERCAKVCEDADVVEFRHGGNTYQDGGRTIANAAAAIRALDD